MYPQYRVAFDFPLDLAENSQGNESQNETKTKSQWRFSEKIFSRDVTVLNGGYVKRKK